VVSKASKLSSFTVKTKSVHLPSAFRFCKRSPASCGLKLPNPLKEYVYSDENYVKLVHSLAYPETPSANAFHQWFSKIDSRNPYLEKYYHQAQKDARIIQENDAVLFNGVKDPTNAKLNAYKDLMEKMSSAPGADHHLASPGYLQLQRLGRTSETGPSAVLEATKTFALSNPLNPSSDILLENAIQKLKLSSTAADELHALLNSNRIKALARLTDSSSVPGSLDIFLGSKKLTLKSMSDFDNVQRSFTVIHPDHENPVIMTIFKENVANKEVAFQNEVIGFQKTGRIIDVNAESLVLVRKPIEGENLVGRFILRKFNQVDIKKLKDQYSKLADDLVRKYALMDMSIRPSKVVIDSRGDMNLIHFYESELVNAQLSSEQLRPSIERAKENAMRNWDAELKDILYPKPQEKAPLTPEQIQFRKDLLTVADSAFFMMMF
jgi:hypothetical protein